MAPLAAKWGRLWRALLGQARIGHEAQSLPTSLSSACPSRPSSLTGLHQQVSLQHGCLQVSGKSRPGGQLARPSSVSTAGVPKGPSSAQRSDRAAPRDAGCLLAAGN